MNTHRNVDTDAIDVENLKEQVSETSQSIMHNLKLVEDKVRSSVEKVKGFGNLHIKERVQAHPVPMVLISSLAGAAVGVTMARKRATLSPPEMHRSQRGEFSEGIANDFKLLQRLAIVGGYDFLMRKLKDRFPALSPYVDSFKKNMHSQVPPQSQRQDFYYDSESAYASVPEEEAKSPQE